MTMVQLLVSWVLSAAALFLSAKLFQGVRLKGDFADALWIAAGYSILSFFLSWFIFGFLGVVTLGIGFIFYFITQLITAAIVLKLTSALSSRFDIVGFVPAVGTAIMLALASQLSRFIL